VRHQHGVIGEAGLSLSKGGRATFDTAFGAFASGRWSRLTKISDIGVSMDISGHCLVELIAYANSSETVIASSDETTTLQCADIRTLAAESFYVAVTALDDGVVVRSGSWTTSQEPEREVRLGVSITTFNRQEYVLKTIERLVELESSEPSVNGHLHVLVVDNAGTYLRVGILAPLCRKQGNAHEIFIPGNIISPFFHLFDMLLLRSLDIFYEYSDDSQKKSRTTNPKTNRYIFKYLRSCFNFLAYIWFDYIFLWVFLIF
jgi:hypothetical protein